MTSAIVPLTDAEKQSIRENFSGMANGHMRFRCCALCGHLDWYCTETDQPWDVTVVEDAYASCQRCMEVRARAPELSKWVLAVIAWKDRRAKESAP